MHESDTLDISKLKLIPVAEITIGQYIINLGSVIETERLQQHYNLIISRLNEKQVIKFTDDAVLAVI
ncbi:hypothetical protein Pedsa_0088 [Pseudopedobacter saltans DSM 12145]|uniref:Uncharacterized protein n=1 Tax=Pseudopedobacter saltans (strain ATCC 51119 / DSM 12145 / JCM 21818 / CCUG 39354 / LMG 10337 / NBRC 100064 / NCIMB 13643) TaxID=762903 RepID=F0SCT6_PSESL|nr:hypothetical protein [Pseudopedobacter saltans]ADY50675.1 hypothetical protein Pedsa_0088 [Pseudopedobacter saltans DSM 12145]